MNPIERTEFVSALEAQINAELVPIAAELTARGESVTAAESLTGGLICASFVDIAGSSNWFPGGFVTYSDGAKAERLGIEPALIREHTAVSSEVALEMARGALAKSGASYAVAVTGLAGPFFDENGVPYPLDARHEPGLVFVAGASRSGEAALRCVFRGTRAEIRLQTVLKAVQLLKSMMKIPL